MNAMDLTGFDATALNVQDSGMDPTLNQVRDHLLAYNPVATPGLMSDTVRFAFRRHGYEVGAGQYHAD